jgi:hypothetical protein
MKKNSRTKSQMYSIVLGFSSSGKTVKEYAKFHGMKYGTYKYWVRKYRAEKNPTEKKSVSSNFIPVQITAKKVEEHRLDIIYPNGVHINFTSPLNISGMLTLKKLVSCLD